MALRNIYNSEKLKIGMAIFGLSLLAVISFELLAKLLIFIADDVFEVGATEARARVPAYDGAPYNPMLLVREEEAVGVIYEPFTIWKSRPYQGTYVNVDEESVRLTLHNSHRDDAIEIWLLGGSTMFGIGAPDDQTIPSHLAELLNETWGVDARVHNLGQPAYVSTQEVIALIHNLQQGKRPHMVVFYDGFNDAQPHVTGAHLNLSQIRDRFESTVRPMVRSMSSYQLGQHVLRRLPNRATAAGYERRDNALAGERAAKALLENYQIANALGETYGFVPIFLFQPINGEGDKPYHPSEQRMLRIDNSESGSGRENTVVHHMRRAIQERLSDDDTLNYYDIIDVFNEHPEPIYVDFVHVSGRGNQIIAERMFEILQSELCQSTPPRLSDFADSQLTSACEESPETP